MKPPKSVCVFGDGPGRYKDPHSGETYCSLECGRRLKEQRQKEYLLTIQIPQESKPIPLPAHPPAQPPTQPQVKVQPPPQSQPQPQTQPQTQPQPKPKSPPQPKSQPQPQSPTQTKPQSPLLVKPATPAIPQKPMIVSTTTPQGQVVQYQLNVAKTIYINSQGVTVPVNQNQVYYLQTALPNGEKSVQPHLMTGSSRMNDGNVYYCMVPMVPLSSNTTNA